MVKSLAIAGFLSALLGGEYNPKTLSVVEQDSILAITSQQSEISRYRLESENEQKIFRHSSMADWYIVDTQKNNKRTALGKDMGQVRNAQLSPNGRYVAFAKDNNLYIHKLDFGTEVAVTKDEDPDIINGIADWLYEEEFGTTALYAWSPDSKQLAFVKLDEHEVPSFSWQSYLTNDQYPTADTLRYPKAGCNNAKASVCVYDVATKAIHTMQINNQQADVYFPRLRWYDNNRLFALRVNRDQTLMEVFDCNAKSTLAHPWYREESKKYFMDYSLFDEWIWLSDGRVIVLSEQNGWRQAFLYSNDGFRVRALTPEGIDVTAIYAVDEKSQTLYYQAATTPATRQLYALNIKKGDITQLTTEEGTHSARFSKDCKHMIECFHSFRTPNTYTLYEVKGGKLKEERVLEDNAELRETWAVNELPEPELIKIPNDNGQELEAMYMQPVSVTPEGDLTSYHGETQYPLVIMHYSGPASQRVLNRWRKKFEYALVASGYAVLIVDSRGSDCRGRAWRNETYMSLGQKEAEDLIAAANWAAKQEAIDSNRIALLGWSYGGYQTLYTMSQKEHPFRAGIAIAPVTDWKLYDTGYTERFMRRPQVNPRGYREASLLNKATDLTGDVLIIHGTADDNVHVQHTMQYIDALVRADKQFEMQLYPDDNHHLRKGNNALHMHERILRFLERALR